MKKPNIILILTDQQRATMMSCSGNKYLKTPAMDSIASNGVKFNRAYCANPVCIPSRFTLMTGRMPSEIGQKSNAVNKEVKGEIPDYIKENGLGYVIKKAGYDVAYGGKEHLPKMKAPDLGFDYICEDEREELAIVCSDYIKQEHNKPYFLVASFINPHDICYMAISEYANTRDLTDPEKMEGDDWFIKAVMNNGEKELSALTKAMQLPKDISKKDFFEKYCPPLPPNFNIQTDEPDAIWKIKEQRQFKQYAHNNFTEEQWRMHRWAYCKLTERVDTQIAQLLNAVKESGQEDNTVIIFTSDHGDMDGAHKMEHKTAMYEEACNVPLIISSPTLPKNIIDNTHLVSNGLDIFPTICDFAGITPPKGLEGKSFKEIAKDISNDDWRKTLKLESEFGNMIVTDRYKYMLYNEGANREQLMDLEKDPNEMQNSANIAENQDVLEKHRKLYAEIF